MSVYSATLGYNETCGRSHEFLRRCCSFAPHQQGDVRWAGDFAIIRETRLKQSEQNDMRGGGEDIEFAFGAANDSCGVVTISAPSEVEIDETAIRNQAEDSETSNGSFEWAVKKGSNDWQIGMLASSDVFCGVLTDGGDTFEHISTYSKVLSLCGTIDRTLFNPEVYFLDNRNTLNDDDDAGLLFAIRNGVNWAFEVRWVDKLTNLTQGLCDADDISRSFTDALLANDLTEADVVSFGMI